MTKLPPDTQATLLLLNRLGGSEAKPLTAAEYNRLAKELVERGLRPANLLKGPFGGYVIDAARLETLMSRGAALALSVERWSQTGVRVVGRSEPEYPQLLKSKLRGAASPLIFHSGSLDLLGREAICVVGSRDPTDAGRAKGACAQQGFAVVSGDARGVDREAMTAALNAGGHAVGVLAESLSAAVLSRRNREPILAGRLLLLSPFDPDSRFTVAHAMDRNRYLYALASAAVVVDSDIKGGTWSGAQENLKRAWTPSLVRVGPEARPGNAKLAELGLLPVTDSDGVAVPIQALIEQARTHAARLMPDLPFDRAEPRSPAESASADALALYEMFVARLRRLLSEGPRSEAAVVAHFELEPGQAERWLSAAERKDGLQRVAGELRWRGKDQAA